MVIDDWVDVKIRDEVFYCCIKMRETKVMKVKSFSCTKSKANGSPHHQIFLTKIIKSTSSI